MTIDLKAAFEAVPRENFIPDTIYRRVKGNRFTAINRASEPDQWASIIQADDMIITQVNDGKGLDGSLISSSSSKPSVMRLMLETLDVYAGQNILEIGTGTGWNAAILGGAECKVTTIEVDVDIAEAARRRLLYEQDVQVVIGDGAHGHPQNALYDRVLSTASVRSVIPFSWVEQTKVNGIVVVPWATDYLYSPLVRLTVHPDGTASGPFVENADFMTLRAHRIPSAIPRYEGDSYTETTTGVHPYWATGDIAGGAFVVSVLAPDIQFHVLNGVHVLSGDANRAGFEVLLWDTARTSWATVRAESAGQRHPVRQHGPRDLWGEVTAALGAWAEWDYPDYTRFGIVVTRHRQWVYLDNPANEVTT